MTEDDWIETLCNEIECALSDKGMLKKRKTITRRGDTHNCYRPLGTLRTVSKNLLCGTKKQDDNLEKLDRLSSLTDAKRRGCVLFKIANIIIKSK